MGHVSMSKIIKIFLAAMAALLFYAVPAFATETAYSQNEVIVKFRAGATQAQIDDANRHARGHGQRSRSGAFKITLDADTSVISALSSFSNDPAVEYAEPNYIYHALASPNDTYYSSYQWNMRIMNADTGWDIYKGSSSVIIAVIDTGVSVAHPDLADKITAGANAGYDFVDNDNNPTDANGHGTHVAGIAAAMTNNGTGVAGVDWNAKIMPVRVLDASGSGDTNDVSSGIYWAADHGAKVINMSLGDSAYSQTVQNAINYAYGKGVVVVAAAGNNGNSTVFYPASGAHVISVAATDSFDNRASFSNYNSFVDVAAPGVNIWSTFWNSGSNTYQYESGTSMATPHVAGLAALVAGLHTGWTPDQIENLIESTATDRGAAGRDNYYGFGRIDVRAALNWQSAPNHFNISAVPNQIAGAPFSVTITAKDASNTTITDFSGPVSIVDTTGTVSPVQSGLFASGVWTGNLTVTKAAASDTLTVLYGSPPVTALSNSFSVNPAALHHLGVTPASVIVNALETAQLTAGAYDAYDNPISGRTFNWSVAGGGTANPLTGTTTTFTAGNTLGQFSVTAASGGLTASGTVSVVANDSISLLYDYGGATSGIWTIYSTGSAFLQPMNSWISASGAWEAARSKTLSGDYNADGIKDIVVFYDYGGATSGVLGMQGVGTSYNSPAQIWTSGPGAWEAARSKPMMGDFNNDNKEDIVIFYDYGAATSGVWLMQNNGHGFDNPGPNPVWMSNKGSWEAARSTPMMGDYNGDGRDDIIIFYDYGSSTSAVWVMQNNGSGFDNPVLLWMSGHGDWEAARSKPMIGDYNGDSKDDIVIFYDYGNATSAVWTMLNSGNPAPNTFNSPALGWMSGRGDWEAARSRPMISDYNADGKDDVLIFYDYGGSTSAVWTMKNIWTQQSAAVFESPVRGWLSNPGSWNAAQSQLVVN